jgi:hypothetical protein
MAGGIKLLEFPWHREDGPSSPWVLNMSPLRCATPEPGVGTRIGVRQKIPEKLNNLDRFGTPFQKVFCHSAKSQTPLAEYFSSCKAL